MVSGLTVFLLSFLRADPAILLRGLRLDGWLGLAATLAGVGVMLTHFAARRPARSRPDEETE
jgi:NO-binding membrane sensor protein with MHYT domain